MAKTAKIKKRQSTLHSRAARRALSPSLSIAVSKTLPDLSIESRPPPNVVPHPSTKPTANTLSANTSSGIRKPRAKQLKHSQRLRQQAGIQRAFDVLDKREVKVLKSVTKDKKVKERKKGWEELNPNITGKKDNKGGKKVAGNAFEALENGFGGENGGREREWVSDEEMPEVDVDIDVPEEADAVLEEADVGVQAEVKEVVVPESVPLPVASALEEDELL